MKPIEEQNKELKRYILELYNMMCEEVTDFHTIKESLNEANKTILSWDIPDRKA